MDNQRILNRSTHNSFVYHLRPCYSSYVRRAEQTQEKDAGNTEGQLGDIVLEESDHDVGSRITRAQTGTVSSPVRKICIVCGCKKKYNATKLYRIENDQRAWKFLAAATFTKTMHINDQFFAMNQAMYLLLTFDTWQLFKQVHPVSLS